MNMVKNISDIKAFLDENDVDTSFFDSLDPKISIGVLNKTPSFYLLKVKNDSEYRTIVFDETSVILNKATPYSSTNTAPDSQPAGTIKTGNLELNFVEEVRTQNLDILTIQNLRHDEHINMLTVELFKYMKFYIAKLKKLPSINQMHTEHSNYLGLVHELNMFIDKLLSFHKSFNLTNIPAYFSEWESDLFENGTKILTHVVLFEFLSQANLILNDENVFVENYKDITNPLQTTECTLDTMWKNIIYEPRVYSQPTEIDTNNPDNYSFEEDFKNTNALVGFDLYNIIKYEDELIFSDNVWWKWIKEELIKKIGGDVVGIPFGFFEKFFSNLNSLKTRYNLTTGKMNGLVLRNSLWRAIKNQAFTNDANIFTLPEISTYEKNQLSNSVVETNDLGHLGFNSIIALLKLVHDLPGWEYSTRDAIITGQNNNDNTLKTILNRIKFNPNKRNISKLANNINIAAIREVEYQEDIVNDLEIVTAVDLSNKTPAVIEKIEQVEILEGMKDVAQALATTETIIENNNARIVEDVMLTEVVGIPNDTEDIALVNDFAVVDKFVQPANSMLSAPLKITAVQPAAMQHNNVMTTSFQLKFI